jgi:hypothetical protein
MSVRRSVSAILTRVEAEHGLGRDETEPDIVGVSLRFQPQRSRTILDPIDDFANLGPEYCIPSVAGLGKVLRVLRAARIAAPADPSSLLGDADRAAALLAGAVGTDMLLELRPHSTVRFVAWTEDGVETIDGVKDVLETKEAFVVLRNSGLPVRVARSSVIRQLREPIRTFEVVDIS